VQALAAEQLVYWDVVEYQQPTGSTQSGSQQQALRLGLVQQVRHPKALQLQSYSCGCSHTTECQKAPAAATMRCLCLVRYIGISAASRKLNA
jgi:hypothetical protein